MNDNSSEPLPNEPQRPIPPRRPTSLLLLAPIAAALMYVVLRPTDPPQTYDAAPQSTLSAVSTPSPRPTVAPKPTATKRASGKPVQLVIYAPDGNGALKRKVFVSQLPQVTPEILSNLKQRAALQNQAVTEALRHLMSDAPDDFPKGAQLRGPVEIRGGVAHLDFNNAFTDPNFWQGSTRIVVSTQAIAHTVAETVKALSGNSKVTVLFAVEGKPIETLGDFDVSEPLAADTKGEGAR
jgi:hypothetical protein